MTDLHEKAERLERVTDWDDDDALCEWCNQNEATLAIDGEPVCLPCRLTEVERERDEANRACREVEAQREKFRRDARARVADAYEEAARVLADEAAEVRGIEAEALTWGGPDPRGPHARKANLNTAMKWQLLSDRIRALARPEETDALDRIRAKAYRDGWRFAYDQCERTGSVPDPDYTAIREDKT